MQVSQAWVNNCVLQNIVGCYYLSLPGVPASNTEVLNSRYDGIVIPEGVDLHVCVWGIMGYMAKLTHGGKPSFEVESHTNSSFFHASHTTFISWSGASNSNNTCLLTITIEFQKWTLQLSIWNICRNLVNEYAIPQVLIILTNISEER